MDTQRRGDRQDRDGERRRSPLLTSTRFSRIHALIVFSGVTAGVLSHSLWPLTLLGAVSLFWYFLRGDLPRGVRRFHAANGVTALRVVSLVPLTIFGQVGPPAALFVMLILGLDGLDGWLARNRKTTSDLGAHFDMESDALLVMVVCSILYFSRGWGQWILVPGLLRYFYVVVLWSGAFKEAPPSTLGRWIYFLFALALVASLWPLGTWTSPVMFLASLMLVFSFSRSLRWSIS